MTKHQVEDHPLEFVANKVKDWLSCQTIYIEPGHPSENPFVERFIGTLKRDSLDLYLRDTVADTQHLIEHCHQEYNRHRPHSSLTYLTPVEYAR